MLRSIGFPTLEVEGIMAALHSHQDAERKLAVTPDQLHEAGFRELV